MVFYDTKCLYFPKKTQLNYKKSNKRQYFVSIIFEIMEQNMKNGKAIYKKVKPLFSYIFAEKT
jgi:hypothetical protein